MYKSLMALSLIFVTPVVFAHAKLIESTPANGATLSEAPQELHVTFSEGVETALSTITLTDDKGSSVDLGKLTADKSSGNTYQIALPKLNAGNYSIDMKITSVDTHRVEDHLKFTVK